MNYTNILDNLRQEHFLAHDSNNINNLLNSITSIIQEIIKNQGDLPVYKTIDSEPISTPEAKNLTIKETHLHNIFEIQKEVIKFMQGSVNVNHRNLVKNVIPTSSIIFLAIQNAVSLYMPNGVTGEDAGSVLMAEVATTNALSKIIGYDNNLSAGFFTFGGTGTNLYALKVSIEKIKISQKNKQKVVILGARSSHFCHQTCVYWLGLEEDSYIFIDSNINQTTNIEKLKETLDSLLKQDIIISCIIGMAGTTSNMAIDDFEEIATIRDFYVKKYNLNYIPHIHADGVIGWAYCFFNDYDFEENILCIPKNVVSQLIRVATLTRKFKFADSIGIDFHKSGYMPYVSSMILFKNNSDTNLLRKNKSITTPLFHEDGAYNPGIFTLETSRSSASMLATWITLNSIGQEGYRSILAHNIEMALNFRKIVNNELKTFVIVNKDFFGSDIFLRCYSPNVIDAEEEYVHELKDENILNINTKYINSFFSWLTSKSNTLGKNISLSKSSAVFYNNSNIPVVGLRIYLMNPYFDVQDAINICKILGDLKSEYDNSTKF